MTNQIYRLIVLGVHVSTCPSLSLVGAMAILATMYVVSSSPTSNWNSEPVMGTRQRILHITQMCNTQTCEEFPDVLVPTSSTWGCNNELV